MPRISKVEKERRAQIQVRSEKAIDSLAGQFRKLLSRHSANLFKNGTEVNAAMGMRIDGEGKASLSFSYTTTVTDGAHFPLDDGQDELPGIDEKGREKEGSDSPQ